ncbi:Oidioi.mRNA.OKI2018_I69.chr1.g433.t1.cds [Oikopleura dioica]|uniref:Oidioi.mRNA.OKI2018_I69.chr1.g433.t1.cds n=1 Tax=Oikopleura dioica TaxID=34765 RepID=A0ABN7SPW2_OIKDI|nr:Oidioi.mRNA.OKI2018_I69.chr1.g433.t1.cds [Oikopleura dioica]
MAEVINFMEITYNMCPDAFLIFGIDRSNVYSKKADKNPDDLQATQEEENTVVATTNVFILPESDIRPQNRERSQYEHSARAGSTGKNLQQFSRVDNNVSGRTIVNKLGRTSNSKSDSISAHRVADLKKAYGDSNRPSSSRSGEKLQSISRPHSGHGHPYGRPLHRELSYNASNQSESNLLGPTATASINCSMGAGSSSNYLATAPEPPARRVTTDDLITYLREVATPTESIGASIANRASAQLLPALVGESTGFQELRASSSTGTSTSHRTIVSCTTDESSTDCSSNRLQDQSKTRTL